MNRRYALVDKVIAGESLTLGERCAYGWGRFIAGPLSDFAWRVKVTPALRERCIDYALRAGAQQGWALREEAEKIAEYIAGDRK